MPSEDPRRRRRRPNARCPSSAESGRRGRSPRSASSAPVATAAAFLATAPETSTAWGTAAGSAAAGGTAAETAARTTGPWPAWTKRSIASRPSCRPSRTGAPGPCWPCRSSRNVGPPALPVDPDVGPEDGHFSLRPPVLQCAPGALLRRTAERFTSRGTLNRSRGSLCSPPGRQSGPLRSRAAPSRSIRNAIADASSDGQSLPLANHISTASGCFDCSCFSVGSNSSCVAARNAVGCPPAMIVQYVNRGGIPFVPWKFVS